MKSFCVRVLLFSLLILGVFEVRYTDAWWDRGGNNGDSDSEPEKCVNFKEGKTCSATSDCGGACDTISLRCDVETGKCTRAW